MLRNLQLSSAECEHEISCEESYTVGVNLSRKWPILTIDYDEKKTAHVHSIITYEQIELESPGGSG